MSREIAQGLLENPLFGLGIGLMSGGDRGGTLASGAQSGLRNMMLMRQQSAANRLRDLDAETRQMQMAEVERQQQVREQMLARGPEAFLGAPGREIPGGDPLAGPVQPGAGPLQTEPQYAPPTGLHAQAPMLAQGLATQYEMDPQGTVEGLNEAMMGRAFASPTGSSLPSDVQSYMFWDALPDEQAKQDFLNVKRDPRGYDIGTGHLIPGYAPGSGTGRFYGRDYPGMGAGAATEEIVKQGLGGYEADLQVARNMITDLGETEYQLSRLFDETDLSSVGLAGSLKKVPVTDANRWDTIKATVQSRLGIDKMMAMKAASPTGATGFGQLTEKELQLLLDNLGQLNQANRPEDIKETILDITRQLQNHRRKIEEGMQRRQLWYERNRFRLDPTVEPVIPDFTPPESPLGDAGAVGGSGWSIKRVED